MSKVICYPFVGDSVGGSQIATLMLAKYINKKQFKSKVVLFEKGPLESYLLENNFEYCLMNKIKIVKQDTLLSQLTQGIKVSFQLAKYIKKNNIAIVHTNDMRMHYTWLIACKLASSAMIWHQHSAYYTRRNILYSCLASKILTVSQFCKKSFPLNMSKRSIIVGNPFIIDEKLKNKALYRNALRVKLNIDTESLVIGYIGNSNPQKRANFFINICHELKKRTDKELHFVMLGNISNACTKDYKANNNYIHKVGYVLSPLEYIAGFDLLVSPAINEGLGRTLIEAMFIKTPVLASDSGAHSEIIKNNFNGFLEKTDSLNDFCNTAINVIEKKMNIKLIVENGYQYVSKNYALNSYIGNVENIYNDVL